MSDTLTDVTGLIESAFKELECATAQTTPHNGDIAAWGEFHDCYQGWICKGHFDQWVNVRRPRATFLLKKHGTLSCKTCGRTFSSVDDWCKAFPL